MKRKIRKARQKKVSTQTILKKLEKLMRLQAMEIQLSILELQETEIKVKEMEQRKESLMEMIHQRKSTIKKYLSEFFLLRYETPISNMKSKELSLRSMLHATIDASISQYADEVTHLKGLSKKLSDLDESLRHKHEQIRNRVNGLKEKQSVLAANKSSKQKQLGKNTRFLAKQIRKLQKIEKMKQGIHRILQIAKNEPSPKKRKTNTLDFLSRKGKLPSPIEGILLSKFGKKYDPKTNLYRFHKGIEIQPKEGGAPVQAVYPGKVVYSGRLAGFQQLLIMEHGKEYYTLMGHLGEILKNTGEWVRKGEVIGKTALDNAPLYFEIRKRHVAMNPLPWLKNGEKLQAKR